jgi:hypothetical protein
MTELIKRYSSGLNVFLFFVAANLVYLFMTLLTIPTVLIYSKGIKLFDLMPFGYDLTYAGALLEKLGPEGREFYLEHQLPFDMIYPGLSGIAYCLLMAWLFKKIKLIDKPAIYLCLIPLVAGLFDYLENFGIIVMITSYPSVSALQVAFTSTFTIIKSMLSAIFFVILIVSFVVYLYKKVV